MSKHPVPWTYDGREHIVDATGTILCRMEVPCRETRAVLLHAAEMWETIKTMTESNGTYDMRWALAIDLHRKIKSEIAAGRKP